MTTKFSICDKVVWYNTGLKVIQEGEIKGVQIIPTGVSKDADGNNILEGYTVLYTIGDQRFVLAETELFADAKSCIEAHIEALEKLRG